MTFIEYRPHPGQVELSPPERHLVMMLSLPRITSKETNVDETSLNSLIKLGLAAVLESSTALREASHVASHYTLTPAGWIWLTRDKEDAVVDWKYIKPSRYLLFWRFGNVTWTENPMPYMETT